MSFGTHTASIADAALVYAVISNAGKGQPCCPVVLVMTVLPRPGECSHSGHHSAADDPGHFLAHYEANSMSVVTLKKSAADGVKLLRDSVAS